MSSENLYRKLSATELSAIILKGSPTSNDRDAGFCSGSSENDDDLSMDHSRLEPRSPTDASEDSVEVKVTPITFTRNKRKSTEPSRVISEQETGPIKKRIRYASGDTSSLEQDPKNPFRPWDQSDTLPHESMPNPAEILVRHPGVTTLHRTPIDYNDIQEEPLALVAKKPSNNNINQQNYISETCSSSAKSLNNNNNNNHHHLNTPDLNRLNTNSCDVDIPLTVHNSNGSIPIISSSSSSSVPIAASTSSSCSTSSQRPQQRNYKNMTRERRIEANARERTRVHTISAAYDTLRKAIPSYSHTQKLSKLSVLRVACSYILTLSRMAGEDYSEDKSEPSLAECIEMVTKTIQTEGKIRKKKDE